MLHARITVEMVPVAVMTADGYAKMRRIYYCSRVFLGEVSRIPIAERDDHKGISVAA